MNRIALIGVALALVLTVVFIQARRKVEVGAPKPEKAEKRESPEARPSVAVGGKSGEARSAGAPADRGSDAPSTAPTAVSPKATPSEAVSSGGQVAVPKPSAKASAKDEHDGVDGDVAKKGADGGSAAEDCDDGGCAVEAKSASAPSLAGVKSPKVWLVAADLRKLPGAKNAIEIGNPEGARATPWKNRSGAKLGDGVRAKGGTTATFVPGLATTRGPVDAVAVCAPGAKECLNQAPSQIKLGLDLNHPESWVGGADKTGKSPKGGSSFTALFVAARGSQSGNPLMENQNGEAGAKQGPFLGWIGPDLVGSIHGLQGVVGVNAVAVPSAWSAGVMPRIYTLRFDRKKSELRIFLVDEKESTTQAQPIEKGDGPDDDQYAAIAIGSKNPGKGAVTYVLEAATFARALEDREICAIHREWNKRYGLKIPAGQLKPCP